MIIIFLLSLVSLLWFKNNCVIAGGDVNQYMDMLRYIKDNIYILNCENMGQYTYALVGLVPSFGVFWWLLRFIGLTDPVIQRMWFVFIWFFSMYGMYLLIKEIAGKEYSKSSAVIGAFLYMFNVFNGLMALNFMVSLTFLVLPYLLILTRRALRDRKAENMNVIYFGVVISYSAILLMNPGYSYILFLLPVLYILFNIKGRRDILMKVKLIFKLILVSIVSSAFFVLPFIYSVKDVSSEITAIAKGGFFGNNSLQEAFRFLSPWSFMTSHYKIPYNPWAGNYNSNLIVVFGSCLIPIMVFAGLVFQKRFNKDILFFCIVCFLGLFLAKGTGRPFGGLYQWAFNNISLFTAFREPWSKFTQLVVFSFSVLLGLGIGNVRLKSRFMSAFSGVAVCSIIIGSFPIYTGKILSTYWNGSVKGNYIKIPGYWHVAADYLKQNKPGGPVFLTPRSPLSVYEWDRGVSTMLCVPSTILDNPVIRYDEMIHSGKEILHIIYGLIRPEASWDFSRLLKLLGVKYLIQQNDVDWRFLPDYTYSPKVMNKILEKQNALRKIESIGKLDIYEVTGSDYVPEIYIPDNITLMYGSIEEIPKLIYTDVLDNRPLILFADNGVPASPDLYNHLVLVDEAADSEIGKRNPITIFNFPKEEADIRKGKYTIKLAYMPVRQEKEITRFDEKIITPVFPKNSRIGFLQLNLMGSEQGKHMPILANWEYNSFCEQGYEKKLVLENFNDEGIEVDLCIRFKYYWKGAVKAFNGYTDELVWEKNLGNFSDFIEIEKYLVNPGKSYLKILCIPQKTDKNWPGEKVVVEKDIGIKVTGERCEGKEVLWPENELILETKYDLTVFNGVKQVDFIFYLDGNDDKKIDAWMQITMDDWMMQQDYNHFKVDIIKAMRERMGTTDYNILSADMVCYPSKGGEIEEGDDEISGSVMLKDFSMNYLYYPSYDEKNNPIEHILNIKPEQVSDKQSYPLIFEIKGVELGDQELVIRHDEDTIFDLKWLILIPEDDVKGAVRPEGMVKDIKRINPVMYKADIETDIPCFLVFSRNYNTQWKAFIQKKISEKTFLGGSVLLAYLKNRLLRNKEITNHIKANGFANAWYLDTKVIEEIKDGDKEILIIFYPQIIQELGILVSLLFLIYGIMYIIWYYRKA